MFSVIINIIKFIAKIGDTSKGVNNFIGETPKLITKIKLWWKNINKIKMFIIILILTYSITLSWGFWNNIIKSSLKQEIKSIGLVLKEKNDELDSINIQYQRLELDIETKELENGFNLTKISELEIDNIELGTKTKKLKDELRAKNNIEQTTIFNESFEHDDTTKVVMIVHADQIIKVNELKIEHESLIKLMKSKDVIVLTQKAIIDNQGKIITNLKEANSMIELETDVLRNKIKIIEDRYELIIKQSKLERNGAIGVAGLILILALL